MRSTEAYLKPAIVNLNALYTDYGNILTIPPYQRPYAWEEGQVRALIDDIVDAWDKNKKAYLVGNLIFHQENGKLNIVDGQQRTITFALMLHVLVELLGGENTFLLHFMSQKLSPLSSKRLKLNYKLIRSKFEYLQRTQRLDSVKQYIEKNVIVSYLVATKQDDAFFYFDSQNTRGRALVRKDLLKVHHIRHMQDETEISADQILTKFVKQWEIDERIDSDLSPSYLGEENDFLEFLFDQILGLTRRSVRREIDETDLQKVDVYKEFVSSGASRRLNDYNQPPLFESYSYDLDSETVRFQTKKSEFISPYTVKGFDCLPFEITQSIAGGSGFFLYTRKYVALLKVLRQMGIFTMLDDVRGAGNSYLRKIYRAALVYYYDKFKDEMFESFSLHLFLLLAYYRANSASIYDRGIVKFQWGNDEAEFDPFKEILLSYSPDHIIHEMQEYARYHCQKPTDAKQNWLQKDFKNTVKNFWQSSNAFHKKREQFFLELWGSIKREKNE